MTNNLERYAQLQRALDQDERRTLAQDLKIVEAIHQLETEALRAGILYVADGKGGWKEDQLTEVEQAVFLAIEELP